MAIKSDHFRIVAALETIAEALTSVAISLVRLEGPPAPPSPPLPKGERLENVFSEAFAEHFVEHGDPGRLRFVQSKTRTSIFTKPPNGERVARIAVGKLQLEVLVLKTLVESAPGLSQIASAEPYNKGQHMLRFRIKEESQAREFGKTLAMALSVRQSGLLTNA